MKLPIYLLTACAAATVGGTSCGRQPSAAPDPMALRAAETLDSLYSHYGIDSSSLLRENHPFDQTFKAGYLAGDDGQQGNPYSYLWPFSGTLSATRALYGATADTAWIQLIDNRIMPGLDNYLDTLRAPAAYASYVSSAPASDRFYDDNVWLGIDFAELYLASGRRDYLDTAESIWKFIESGTDSILGGGIYWCEQKKGSKNTCSNAPGAVYALRLFEATADSSYLRQGEELYRWTKTTLQDTTDCLYFDNMSLDGNIGRAKFAYNSGQMMQAATLLYNATGNPAYLYDARSIAGSAFSRFFNGGEAADSLGTFPLIGKGNVWFTAVMMRGFNELYKADGDPQYMDAFMRNLDHAWLSMRDADTGLFNEDWSGAEKTDKKWLLTQGAMAEMLALAAEYNSRKNQPIHK